MTEVQKSIRILREDAIARGMSELAITYGWSAIRLGEELYRQQKDEIYRITGLSRLPR